MRCDALRNLIGISLLATCLSASSLCSARGQTPGSASIEQQELEISLTTSTAPSIRTVSPHIVTTGIDGTTITVMGSKFVAGAYVTWDGADLATTYVTASELTAYIPESDLVVAGKHSIAVVDPGGSTSKAVALTVDNPDPVLTSVSPSAVTAGSGAVTCTLTGSNFVSTSVVKVNGHELATTYISAAQISATIPAAYLSSVTTLRITVYNPAPGGGTSASKSFAVQKSVPTLTSVSPNAVMVGSGATNITVTGTNFNAGSVVEWNSAVLPTTYISSTQLSAVVPAKDLKTAGSFKLTVVNQKSGNTKSSAIAFTVSKVNPNTATITGTVIDNVTGDGVAGLLVQVYGYTSYSATTASDGSFSISGVPLAATGILVTVVSGTAAASTDSDLIEYPAESGDWYYTDYGAYVPFGSTLASEENLVMGEMLIYDVNSISPPPVP